MLRMAEAPSADGQVLAEAAIISVPNPYAAFARAAAQASGTARETAYYNAACCHARAGALDEGLRAFDQLQVLRGDLAVEPLLLVGHHHPLGGRGGREHRGQDLVVGAAGGGGEEGVGVQAQPAPRMPRHPRVVVVRHAVDQRAVEVEQEGLHLGHGLRHLVSGSLR